LSDPLVVVIMGSRSDEAKMRAALEVLERLGIGHDVRVLSAHRMPEDVDEYASTAASRGIRVIIAGAGMAAHLAGAVASRTLLPVIGVPLSGSPFSGLDALLSTVQMPKGVPVATVAVDGAANAAYLAARVIALSDPEVRERLEGALSEMADAARAADPGAGGAEHRGSER